MTMFIYSESIPADGELQDTDRLYSVCALENKYPVKISIIIIFYHIFIVCGPGDICCTSLVYDVRD